MRILISALSPHGSQLTSNNKITATQINRYQCLLPEKSRSQVSPLSPYKYKSIAFTCLVKFGLKLFGTLYINSQCMCRHFHNTQNVSILLHGYIWLSGVAKESWPQSSVFICKRPNCMKTESFDENLRGNYFYPGGSLRLNKQLY